MENGTTSQLMATWTTVSTVMDVGLAQMVPGWKNIAAAIGAVIVQVGGMKILQVGIHIISICGLMA